MSLSVTVRWRVCRCLTEAQTYSGRPVRVALHLGKDQITRFPVSSHVQLTARLEEKKIQTTEYMRTHFIIIQSEQGWGASARDCSHNVNTFQAVPLPLSDNNAFFMGAIFIQTWRACLTPPNTILRDKQTPRHCGFVLMSRKQPRRPVSTRVNKMQREQDASSTDVLASM